MALAKEHIAEGALQTLTDELDLNQRRVRFFSYALWADEYNLPQPFGFPTKPLNRLVAEGDSKDHPMMRWPWGSHETKLLQHLASAAELWRPVSEGGLYDPEDPTTAPTNEQIKEYLDKRGVSGKLRESIATILRADNMPVGPRPYKS